MVGATQVGERTNTASVLTIGCIADKICMPDGLIHVNIKTDVGEYLTRTRFLSDQLAFLSNQLYYPI